MRRLKDFEWKQYRRDVANDRIGIAGVALSAICLVIGLSLEPSAVAQATFPTTTLATGLTGWPAAHQPALNIFLASTAAIVPGQNPVSSSGIGSPSGHTNQILMIDTEAMCVTGPINPNGSVPVKRGCQGTYVEAHNAGATVWVGFPSYYAITAPYGACNAPTLPVLPTIYLNTGVVYNCVAGQWVAVGNASMNALGTSPIWHAHPKVKVIHLAPWYVRFPTWIGHKVAEFLGGIQGGPGGTI